MYLIFRPNIQFQGRQSILQASVASLGLTSQAAESPQRGNCNRQETYHVSSPSYLWILPATSDTPHPRQHTALSFDPQAGQSRAFGSGGGTPQLPCEARGSWRACSATAANQRSYTLFAEPSAGKSDKEKKQRRPPPWVRRGEDADFVNNTW